MIDQATSARVPHFSRVLCARSGDVERDPASRKPEAGIRHRPARLTVYQGPRNPSERERTILTLIAEGQTHKQAAGHLGLTHHSVTNALARMRDRYTTPTNESLIALATRLQWITVAIEIHQDGCGADAADRALNS